MNLRFHSSMIEDPIFQHFAHPMFIKVKLQVLKRNDKSNYEVTLNIDTYFKQDPNKL